MKKLYDWVRFGIFSEVGGDLYWVRAKNFRTKEAAERKRPELEKRLGHSLIVIPYEIGQGGGMRSDIAGQGLDGERARYLLDEYEKQSGVLFYDEDEAKL